MKVKYHSVMVNTSNLELYILNQMLWENRFASIYSKRLHVATRFYDSISIHEINIHVPKSSKMNDHAIFHDIRNIIAARAINSRPNLEFILPRP